MEKNKCIEKGRMENGCFLSFTVQLFGFML
jgi:hypothetical protein